MSARTRRIPTTGVTAAFLAAALSLGAADAMATPPQQTGVARPAEAGARMDAAARAGRESAPPAPWLQTDPGEALYSAGRDALNTGEYREAAARFRELREEHPGSGYVASSLYWEAWARYRIGDDEELERASDLLRAHLREHPEARTADEARNLLVRIRGKQARLGNAAAAEEITAMARQGVETARLMAEAHEEQVEQALHAAAEGVRAGMEGARAGMEALRASGFGAQELSEECRTEDHELRMAALNALLQMDDDRALPVLEKVMRQRGECSASLRKKAVFLLAQQESDRALDLLLETARSDPEMAVRRDALFWLGQADSERAVEALESVLADSAEAALHERAIFALAQHDSERAGEILRGYALRMDAPDAIREKAIFWLGQGEEAAPVSYFRDLYGRLESRRLKERVLFAVAQREGPEARRWLTGLAKDGSEPIELRKKALFWAGQADLPVSELEGLYSAVDDREMREQVIFVLSQLDEPGAVDALMEVARSDPDPELRKKAIFWLGQSDDPRVGEFLLELVNRPGEAPPERR